MKAAVNSKEAVPIIVTHRTIKRMPKVNVTKKFVGLGEGFKSLAYKALDIITETFWIEEKQIVDPGEFKVVHYAIDVEDDDINPEYTSLVATRLHGDSRPGCGAHFEVVKVIEDKPENNDVIKLPKEEEPIKPLTPEERGCRDSNAGVAPRESSPEYMNSYLSASKTSNTKAKFVGNRPTPKRFGINMGEEAE